MLHIFEGVCIWLLQHMRAARAQKDLAAHSAYTVALMLAPKLLLPLNAQDLFGTKREELFYRGDFETLFAMA